MSNFKDWAKTPPLGWNSWDCFGAAVTEKQIKENAGYMARYLKPYGWEYIVCDIQWYEPNARGNIYNDFADLAMDGYGRLLPAHNRFPSARDGRGFKPLADCIHSLGLKFGLHMMRGVPRRAVFENCPVLGSKYTCREIAHPNSICSWNTDMYGLKNCAGAQEYYNSVINLYASWGVDFIKCDDICVTEYSKESNPYSAYYEIEMIRKAIDGCGRKIVLSLSPGPALREKAAHLSKNANMWRLTGDFWDSWEKLYAMFSKCREWDGVSRPGNYPDCDMLPLGRISKNGAYCGEKNRYTNFTRPEQYTLMTLWGIFKSPLMFGGNLPENDDFTLSLLTNEEYIKMNRTCFSSREISGNEKNNKGVIVRAAEGQGCKYLAVFNTDSRERKIKTDITKILMPDVYYEAFDIWEKKSAGRVKDFIVSSVKPHGAKLYKLLTSGL